MIEHRFNLPGAGRATTGWSLVACGEVVAVDIRILGSLQVLHGGEPVALGGRRQRMVLAILVQRANQTVSSSELIDAVWGSDPPASARKTVQAYVSRLRRVIGRERIDHRDAGYRLRVNQQEVDAERFEQLAATGHELLRTDPGQTAAVLGDALALWRGTPWGDLADQPALEPDVVRLGELRLAVVEDRLAAEVALGLSAMVVGELESLVDSHPYRERLRELLMLALYRSDQQGRALEVFRETSQRLAQDLGVDPGSGLVDLHARILHHDPDLQVDLPIGGAPESPGDIRNPYKGLRPFGEADAGDFFGRDDLVGDIVAALVNSPLVTVVGPSGSGKSSAVRAGVLPALGRGALPGSRDWVVAVMVPGAHPFAELESALARAAGEAVGDLAPAFRGDDLDLLRAVLRVRGDPETRVLLVVDQFEELFLTVDDEQVRERFATNLVEAAEDPNSGLSVLATLRADMVDRPLAHARLGRLVAGGQVPVLPLEPAELEEACVAPARGVGVTMEPEVAAQLVADVARRPGALPLLQFSLTELFDRRRGAVLTTADLDAMGGIEGVVARRAEATFGRLDDEHRSLARQVFLRLVAVGRSGNDTRQRAGRDDLRALAEGSEVDTVLAHFGGARLLTFDRDPVANVPTVMLPHDAMLRAWPRLRDWVDESRSDLRFRRALVTAAAAWQAAGRHDDYLLPGSRAREAAAWMEDAGVVVDPSARAFVEASGRRHREHQAAVVRRLERERELQQRSVRRLRALVVVLLVAVAGAVVSTVVVADRGRATAAARAQAVVEGELNRARELTAAAVAIRHRDSSASLLLALHAVDISRLAGRDVPAETVAALHWGLQAAHVPYPVGGGTGVALDGPEGPQGVFPMDLDELVGLAQSAADRQLTSAECATWLGVDECPDLPGDLAASLPPGPTALAPINRSGAQPLAGTTVRMLAAGVSEPELAIELAALEEATGITFRIDQEPSSLELLLPSRLEDGRVDIIALPQPARVAAMARAGELMDLSAWMDPDRLREDLSDHLVSLGTVGADGSWPAADGRVFGLPYTINLKSLVWYPVAAFRDAGYPVPSTQQELDELVARIEADGRTPWCHGEGSGLATGWPGTDWIEDLVLVGAGPDVFDRWVAHDIPFDQAAVRAAFERYAELVLAPGRVHGGQRFAAVVPPGEALFGMFEEPPACWLMHQASFAPNWFPAGTIPGQDVAVFPFPPRSGTSHATVLGAGAYLVAVNDRPEVREVLRHMVGPDWGRRLIAQGDWSFMANRHVPLDEYADPAAREIASTLQDALAADTFRFDGSDLMPPEVQLAFWDAMATFTATGPEGLDRVLEQVEAAWPAASEDPAEADTGAGGG